MEDFKKIVDFGTFKPYGTNYAATYSAKIEYMNNILTICGGFRKSLCQNKLDLLKVIPSHPKKDIETIKRFLAIWDNYHLNNMHAGTLKQEKALDDFFGNVYVDYVKACNYLKSIDLYRDDYNGKIVEYGRQWLYYPVPDDVLEFLKSL